VIFDDTIAEKIKPLSQAKHSIQATGFHQSHLKGKQVWGHQLLTMMLSCGKVVLPYCIECYEKGMQTGIKTAYQWIYEQANNKVPIDEILAELQLA
jgi:hypothetical protein